MKTTQIIAVSALFALAVFAAYTFYEKGKLAERNKNWSIDYAALKKESDSLRTITAKAETVLVATIDTVKVFLSRPILRIDTVNLVERIRDTVWVKEYIQTSQQALAACNVLVADCETFRARANDRFVSDSTRIWKLEHKPERSCKMYFLVGNGTGALATIGIASVFKEQQ